MGWLKGGEGENEMPPFEPLIKKSAAVAEAGRSAGEEEEEIPPWWEG